MGRLLDYIAPIGPWKRGSGHPFRLDMVVWLWVKMPLVWIRHERCVDGEIVREMIAPDPAHFEPEPYWLDSMDYIFDSMSDHFYPNALTGAP